MNLIFMPPFVRPTTFRSPFLWECQHREAFGQIFGFFGAPLLRPDGQRGDLLTNTWHYELDTALFYASIGALMHFYKSKIYHQIFRI